MNQSKFTRNKYIVITCYFLAIVFYSVSLIFIFQSKYMLFETLPAAVIITIITSWILLFLVFFNRNAKGKKIILLNLPGITAILCLIPLVVFELNPEALGGIFELTIFGSLSLLVFAFNINILFVRDARKESLKEPRDFTWPYVIILVTVYFFLTQFLIYGNTILYLF